jgi:HPt (histidine-containing phosphotransfer) domain-containing protein
VANFLIKLDGQLDAMQGALAVSDWDQLAKLAHWLKGTGGTVGFDCLTAPAARLETFAKAGDMQAATKTIHDLRRLVSSFDSVAV